MRHIAQSLRPQTLKIACIIFLIGFQFVFIARATAQGSPDPVVVSFTLINADSDQPIAGFDPIALDAVLNLDTLPTLNLNIMVNLNDVPAGSVTFDLDGEEAFSVDNFAPFTLAGDTNGDYYGWTPAPGEHTITAFPFVQPNGAGKVGEGATLRFSVVSSAENIPPSVNIYSDAVMTLPTNSTVLNGTADDPDGNNENMTILWTMQDAPVGADIPKMSGANSVSLLLEELVEGTYRFRLNVIDEKGLGNFADTFVYVFPIPDQPPIVDAGDSLDLALPKQAGTLYGNAYDDGHIVQYLWEQLDGPVDVIMNGVVGPTLQVSKMTKVGHYWFQLTVTDDSGQTATDDVTISINPDPNNLPPTITVSEDITLTMPVNSAELTGTFADTDGWLDSLEWYKVSGPPAIITPTNTLTTTVSDLTAGQYVFRLNGYDNSGNLRFDTVRVLVNPAPNDDPVLTVPSNITIKYPKTEVVLNAMASDDGEISAWVWTQAAGPSGITLWDTDTPTLRVTDLTAGQYRFKVTVFDDRGAKVSQLVSVTMTGAPPTVVPQPIQQATEPAPPTAQPVVPSAAEAAPLSISENANRVGFASADLNPTNGGDTGDSYYLSLSLICLALMGGARWGLFRPKKAQPSHINN